MYDSQLRVVVGSSTIQGPCSTWRVQSSFRICTIKEETAHDKGGGGGVMTWRRPLLPGTACLPDADAISSSRTDLLAATWCLRP